MPPGNQNPGQGLLQDAGPAKSTQSYLYHPMVNALPQTPGVFISCQKSEIGPAQTEVVWKRVPWPPPLYASENESPLMLRGWEGAEGS